MKKREISKQELKDVKGGFNPQFSVNEKNQGSSILPTIRTCDNPPPFNSNQCPVFPQLTEECKY